MRNMQMPKTTYIIPAAAAVLLSVATLSLQGCGVNASIVMTAVTEIAKAAASGAASYEMTYVKADDYPGEALRTDSICPQVDVTGGVHVKVRRDLERSLQVKVARALKAEGFDVRDAECDVNLQVTFKARQLRMDDEPQAIAITGYAEKNGKRVYVFRSQRFGYAPIDDDFTALPAQAIARMRMLYADKIQLNIRDIHEGKYGKGYFFRKVDSYSWEDFEDDTVCISSDLDLGPEVTEEERQIALQSKKVRVLMDVMVTVFRTTFNDISGVDTDPEDCPVKIKIVSNVSDDLIHDLKDDHKVNMSVGHDYEVWDNDTIILSAQKDGKVVYEAALNMPPNERRIFNLPAHLASRLAKTLKLAEKLER